MIKDTVYYRQYYADHKEERKAQARAYYSRHREERTLYSRTYRLGHEDQLRSYNHLYHKRNHLRNRYGISVSDYNSVLAAQGGVCAICETADWGIQGPHVDHDHGSKEVRGILCNRCNRAIGLLHDRSGLAKAAAAYLER